MQIFALLLIIIGTLIGAAGTIWLLLVGFGESVWWGLGMLLVPFLALIFVIIHWGDAKKPFVVQLAGMAILFVGRLIMTSTGLS